MADSSDSITAPGANPCDNFDPAAWLSRFRDAGGWRVVGADDRILIGWQTKGRHPAENDHAGALWREIKADPTKGREVWDTLLSATPWHHDAQSAPGTPSVAFIAGAIASDGAERKNDVVRAGIAPATYSAR